MNSILFSFHDKLGKDQGIVWNQSKFSWPVFSSADVWSVKLNLTCLLNEGGCSLKRLDIRSMSKLCLRIASYFFKHPSSLYILFLLLLGSHYFDTFDKHGQMNRSWSLLNGKIESINNIGLFIEIFVIKNQRNLFVGSLENLQSTLVIEVEIRFQRLILFKSLFQVIQEGLWIKKLSHFLNVKSTFFPFLNQRIFNTHFYGDECYTRLKIFIMT